MDSVEVTPTFALVGDVAVYIPYFGDNPRSLFDKENDVCIISGFTPNHEGAICYLFADSLEQLMYTDLYTEAEVISALSNKVIVVPVSSLTVLKDFIDPEITERVLGTIQNA